MKKILLLFCLLGGALLAGAEPLWMRYCAISPDGSKIAFAYKGDVYVVNSDGGMAQRLTTEESFESSPVWSNDGKTIAFVSDRNGGRDIFVVPAAGGVAKRVTTHSARENVLAFSKDDKFIYYSALMQDPASSVMFPGGWITELYRIPVNGGRPELVVAAPVAHLCFDKDGQSFLYENQTGGENEWRKHHVSSVARNIFYYNAATGKHEQVTTNVGEDRSPLYAPDGKMVFLSERDGGSFNVYKGDVQSADEAVALTSFKKHPVRFLTQANDGKLCFGWQGEIYTLIPGQKPQNVAVEVLNDTEDDQVQTMALRGVSEFAMPDAGDDIAVISRGEVFVVSGKYGTSKQVSHTPEAEQGITISPDGKTIVYASCRTGVWNLYKATRTRKEDVDFSHATLINEEPLFKDGVERIAPSFSPDGKELAFIEGRKVLKVLNLKTNKVRQITDGSQYYGTNDSGFEYQWSPDGNWFTLTLITNRRDPYSDVGVVSAKEGGKIYNVTNSAYFDLSPQWVMGGNAILFVSDRLGMRSHASWGSQNDVYIAFMNQETMDRFLMTKEELDLMKEEEKLKAEMEKKEVEGDKKGKEKNKESKNAEKSVVIDLERLSERIVRLTPMSSKIASAVLTEDGESLYFLSAFEGGYDLWKKDTRTGSVNMLKKLNNPYSFLMLDKQGKTLYVLGSRPSKMSLAGNNMTSLAVNLQMELDKAAERKYMFDHVFTQQEKRFYRTDYHGVDLKDLKKAYEPFLKHINNNYDFTELLSEVLGELNVSHTGAGYRGRGAEKATPEFGLLFDWNYKGDGLKIDEVLEFGPFDNSFTKVKAGSVIEKIDGEAVKAGEDYYPLINGKANTSVLVSFYNPQTKERWEEVVKPISAGQQNSLLYKRWIKSRAVEVERLSKGRLGYVHIASMDDESYRDVYADILGKYNLKEGIVIDTRNNGGGRLHEDIEILFSGKKYLEQVVRGVVACEMPSRRYNKPSIMLICEANYSNAHGTPWVYKTRGLGSLVGMPVPGTMSSVNWETLQDPSMYFGIPVIGYRTKEGNYLENTQLEPDFKVRNDYDQVTAGRDQQLEKAVEQLLKEIDAKPKEW